MVAANHKTTLSPHGRFSLQHHSPTSLFSILDRSSAGKREQTQTRKSVGQLDKTTQRHEAETNASRSITPFHYHHHSAFGKGRNKRGMRDTETWKVICHLHSHHRHWDRHQLFPCLLALASSFRFLLSSSYPLVELNRTLFTTHSNTTTIGRMRLSSHWNCFFFSFSFRSRQNFCGFSSTFTTHGNPQYPHPAYKGLDAFVHNTTTTRKGEGKFDGVCFQRRLYIAKKHHKKKKNRSIDHNVVYFPIWLLPFFSIFRMI